MAIAFQATCTGVRYEVRTAGRSVRLYTNGAFHSQYNPNHLFTGGVWDLLSLPSLSADQPISEALILGVGGGTVIHQLHAMHEIKRIVGIELDPMHLQIGKTLFNLSYAHTKLFNTDAREWLIGQQEKYDYIVDDVYLHSDADPQRPFYPDRKWCELLFQHLKPRGVVVQNHIDRNQALDVKRYFELLFDQVLVFRNSLYSNIVIAGFLTQTSKTELKRRCSARLREMPSRITSRLRHYIS